MASNPLSQMPRLAAALVVFSLFGCGESREEAYERGYDEGFHDGYELGETETRDEVIDCVESAGGSAEDAAYECS